jgi:hypothetical protein
MVCVCVCVRAMSIAVSPENFRTLLESRIEMGAPCVGCRGQTCDCVTERACATVVAGPRVTLESTSEFRWSRASV